MGSADPFRISPETRKRVITGAGGGALLLFLIISGGMPGVFLVAAALATAMCWELSSFMYLLPDRREKMFALTGAAWLFIFINLLLPRSMLECLVVAFIAMFAYYLAVAERHSHELRKHFEELILTVFVLVYVVTFAAFLPLIRDGSNGVRWILLFLLIVWAGDSGAYFVGRRYGRHKLYPLISPGKSLEGALGGLVSSLVIAAFYKLLGFRNLSWVAVIVTAISVGVVSQIGDLCESFFKRAYNIKDTGSLLPGHGGVLDRFDGVLFSLPVMYFCVKFFS